MLFMNLYLNLIWNSNQIWNDLELLITVLLSLQLPQHLFQLNSPDSVQTVQQNDYDFFMNLFSVWYFFFVIFQGNHRVQSKTYFARC